MSPDKVAYMASRIGRFFAHQPRDKAVAASEAHLRPFRHPRMRAGMVVHPDGETVRLDP
jgi:formate dehydrogenase subunit delta